MARACPHSSTAGTPIVPAVVERGLVSNVPPFRQRLRHRADHLGDFLDDLADLVFADDERRGEPPKAHRGRPPPGPVLGPACPFRATAPSPRPPAPRGA